MQPIRLMHSTDVPIYKQIVAQLQYMIEAGQLSDGDKLPSARLLATNLHINRHTVSKAYAELRDAGLAQSHRSGMVISGADHVRGQARARHEADEVLTSAIKRCLEFGLTAAQVSNLAVQIVAHLEATRLRVSFVECNVERAEYFAKELSDQLDIDVKPLVLTDLHTNAHGTDLLLTTFFHLAEVRRIGRDQGIDVVAIVVAPHVQTLVRLASVPKTQQVGVLYSTEDQAQGIRDSLVQSGLKNIEVLHGTEDSDLASVDVVVVPSEMPELQKKLDGRVEVIEFGNVLDEASTRMVATVIEEAAGSRHEELSRRAPRKAASDPPQGT